MSRPTIRVTRAVSLAFLTAGFLLSGCGDDHGGIDTAASKKIAEEKGIGPGTTIPGQTPSKKAAPTGGLTQPKTKPKK